MFLRALALLLCLTTPLLAADDYKLGPDSLPKPGVPKGKVTKHTFDKSRIFEGTTRDFWIYVPAQYDGKSPACLMVFQDGAGYVSTSDNAQFRTPDVLDNLIHEGSMPFTVGLFINPGHRPSPNDNPQSRRANNRSFEYDSLGNAYARFLIEEMIPEVERLASVKLTTNPDGRAICGSSSGGICAFTVAWERPDAFRKVVSHIGSFTNIRGGHVYPALIRKSEKRPIRVFLQDGSNDLDNAHGNWWLSNLQMEAALKFSKYDHKFVGGDGAHNGKHGGSVLPDTLRWLWRGWKETPAAW